MSDAAPGTVPDLLRDQVTRRAGQAAVATPAGDAVSFGALDRRSDALARALVRAGAARGDRIALAFANAHAPDYAVAYFAAQKAGAAVVPLAASAPAAEAARILAHAEPRWLIADDTAAGPAEAAGARLRPWAALAAHTDSAAPGVETGPGDPTLPALAPTDAAELLYTSGTTGLPKGVRVPHRNAVGIVSRAYETLLGGRTFLNPLPLATYAAHAQLLVCVKAGLTNLVMERFAPAAFLELLARREVATAFAVSSMWLRILKEHPDLDGRDLTHLLSVSFGAAPMPPWAVTRLGELLPHCLLLNIYGLTEGGSAVCMLQPGDHRTRPGSVGRPVADTQVRVLGPDGAPRAAGETGEVHLRLPGVPPRSYFRDEAATATVFADGWVRTGDLGYLDADGYLYLVDRAKDVILQGGNNVSCAEVEAELLAHPDLLEAAVIGLPDPTLGETVCAVVVPRPGAAADGEALRAFLRARLAGYKVPRTVVSVAALPRNATGKVLKRELRARLARQGGPA